MQSSAVPGLHLSGNGVYQDLAANNHGMKYSVGAKTWISFREDSIFNA